MIRAHAKCRGLPKLTWLSLLLTLNILAFPSQADDEEPKVFDYKTGPPIPGEAGYALVFHDNVIVKTDFKDFPSSAMTFEAWISTSDFCHPGAIMSYALDSDSNDVGEVTRKANHFVIFDVKNILACHDFEFIDIIPDYFHASCHGHYNTTPTDTNPTTGRLVDREGKWRHLAVTWTQENEGETIIYIDGSVVGRAKTKKKNGIEKDGAFMLGGEQDCYGGCTDPKQGFYGMMDEVRIWKTVRKQDEIVRYMRSTGEELQGHKDLVAYWKFDDPGTTEFEGYGILRDSSGRGNDLDVFIPPTVRPAVIHKDGKDLKTSELSFKNNYAMNEEFDEFPAKDITIEFWARSGAITGSSLTSEHYAEFLSFATVKGGSGADNPALIDDAIRIERYLTEYNETQYLKNTNTNTVGSISVHVNSNRQGNGRQNDNWIDFATEWIDNDWHHIALTWKYSSGETNLYFDGKKISPFWKASEGRIKDEDPSNGGVSNVLAKGVERYQSGSLVLGQNQECYGGCFSPSSAFDGSLANVRIWDRVLDRDEIQDVMFRNDPANIEGLKFNFKFHKARITGDTEKEYRMYDHGSHTYLRLGSVGPTFQFSSVPLTTPDGKPVMPTLPGYTGFALELSDRQLLMVRNFKDFPEDAITVEFWMWSIDACREGVPFSYADGGYQLYDNAFLIFNYNDWGIAVMEEEGEVNDHNAGFASTDGKWHHIAVTWESRTGKAILYDNGKKMWEVTRAKGKKILSGGTLVIGREQDCLGGCFDSAPGGVGDIQPVKDLEYGPQDFYGLIEGIRIWNTVRTQEEILNGMMYDRDVGSGKENHYINANDRNLVSWWKFDEGQGFSVKDETGHGHTLRILSEPRWVVSRWLENCGNGILEASEQCDDANRQNGDGCDSECQVESGWQCTSTSPSKCSGGSSTVVSKDPKDGRRSRVTTHSNRYEDTETDESSSHKKSGSSAAGVTIFLVVSLLILAFMVVAYAKREVIYEQVPGLRTFVNNAQDRMNQTFGRHGQRYSLAAVDPEEVYVSPGFVDSQPPASNQAATANVPYEPIGDSQPN